MTNKNKNRLYGVIATFLTVAVAVALSFIFSTFWGFRSNNALVCYWVIKGIFLAAFVLSIFVPLFTKTDKSMGAFAILAATIFVVFPLAVRLLLLIPGIAGIVISYTLAVLIMAGYGIYVLLLASYANNNTDTQIQTEYKETNYEKYKKAQKNIEEQKEEQNKQ